MGTKSVRISLRNSDESALLQRAKQMPQFTKRPLTDQEIAMATVAYANGASIHLKRERNYIDVEHIAEHRLITQKCLAGAITDPGYVAANIDVGGWRRQGPQAGSTWQIGAQAG